MAGKKEKVFVALSGGVDSSTATALLLEKGHHCSGIFMVTCNESAKAQPDVERLAERIGIKLYVLDVREDFKQIREYFCSEYKKGRTPNPCVMCNRKIKFGRLLNFAKDNGAKFLATGHYARIIRHNNSAGLYATVNQLKDQSYALAMIDRKALEHILLPMGRFSKDQTRQMAAKFGLGTEQKEESQEICFIPDNDYVGLLEQMCPELVRRGNIIDSSGKIIGEHNGVHRFTVGQRRGLRVAMGRPWYVTKIDAETNTVTLGPKQEVMHSKLSATGVNWLVDEPKSSFKAKVKIRYNSKAADATVYPGDDGVKIEFDEPISAITQGQLAAVYVEDNLGSRVIGGGWINKISN